MAITHAKVSAIPDGGDSTLVRPSDWNAGHVGFPAQWTAPDPNTVQATYSLGEGASLELEDGDGVSGGGAAFVRGGDGPEDGSDATLKGGMGTDSGTYGVSANPGEIRAGGASPNNGGLAFLKSGSDPVSGNGGAAANAFGATGSAGGDFNLNAGSGSVGLPGGTAFMRGGNGDENNDTGARFTAKPGDGVGNDGKIGITSNNSTGTVGQVLTADGTGTATWAAGTPSFLSAAKWSTE